MASELNVDSIGPVNPLVAVNFTGPAAPTYNGTPLAVLGNRSGASEGNISTPGGVAQTAIKLTGGTGAPSNSEGSDGWIYFRSDGGVGTTIYQRRAGVWVAVS